MIMASTPLLALTLKELRMKHNYTQKYVSHYLNMSRGGYAQYEADGRTPSLDILLKLSELYQIDIDVLVNRNTIPETIAEHHNEDDTPCLQDETSYHVEQVLDLSQIRKIGNYLLHANPGLPFEQVTQDDINLLAMYKQLTTEQQEFVFIFCQHYMKQNSNLEKGEAK